MEGEKKCILSITVYAPLSFLTTRAILAPPSHPISHFHLKSYSYRCYFLIHHKCPPGFASCCVMKDSIHSMAEIIHLILVWMDKLTAGNWTHFQIILFLFNVLLWQWSNTTAKQNSEEVSPSCIGHECCLFPKEEQTNVRLSNSASPIVFRLFLSLVVPPHPSQMYRTRTLILHNFFSCTVDPIPSSPVCWAFRNATVVWKLNDPTDLKPSVWPHRSAYQWLGSIAICVIIYPLQSCMCGIYCTHYSNSDWLLFIKKLTPLHRRWVLISHAELSLYNVLWKIRKTKMVFNYWYFILFFQSLECLPLHISKAQIESCVD